MQQEAVAHNFDLTRERVIRWLTLLFLVPQFYFGIVGISSQYKPNIIALVILILPLPAQALFMAAYRHLNRKQRSTGMVIDYIMFALGLAFTLYVIWLHYHEGYHHGV